LPRCHFTATYSYLSTFVNQPAVYVSKVEVSAVLSSQFVLIINFTGRQARKGPLRKNAQFLRYPYISNLEHYIRTLLPFPESPFSGLFNLLAN